MPILRGKAGPTRGPARTNGDVIGNSSLSRQATEVQPAYEPTGSIPEPSMRSRKSKPIKGPSWSSADDTGSGTER